MGALLSWISDTLVKLPGPAALAVVFLLPALEASIFLGFLFPGEIAVVIGGFLAFNHTVNLAAVLACAIAGAVIGDSVGYEVGKRWGDALLVRLPQRFVKPAHIEQGKELINRLGGKAVFSGRFAAALRALVPGLCGVSTDPLQEVPVLERARRHGVGVRVRHARLRGGQRLAQGRALRVGRQLGPAGSRGSRRRVRRHEEAA